LNYYRSTEETLRLSLVARGEQGADLALINATLLNVYTGELLERYTVCIWKKWIAYVGDDPKGSIRKETRVVDVDGKVLIPGFLDAHTHLAWLCTPYEFLKHAIAGGTTTIVTETLEPYPVAGLAGVIDFLESLKNQPVKIFATAPPMVSISAGASAISIEDLKELLKREEVLGLGESYWQAVLQHPELYLPILTEALRCGKKLEGHTAGASGKKLMSYLTAGISSCHEPTRAEEVLQRLRLGIYVMIREGSIRRDLAQISKIKDKGVDFRRLVLVSDGLEPAELMEKGYMEYIVQKAVDCGFDPVSAVQMATLNPAEHFGLDHLIGGIAPGRFADLSIIANLNTLHAECVISNGKIVAEKGVVLKSPTPHRFSQESLNSIPITQRLKPEDFRITPPLVSNEIAVRVIEMVSDLVTQEVVLNVPIQNGSIRVDTSRDILKVAAVDRTLCPGKIFTGLIRGFRMKSGALACSAAWDTTNIIVVGADEVDMATAVNRVIELQGGAVLCRNEKILQELALPIFGIMSDEPLKDIARKVQGISKNASKLGIPFRNPVLTLITLTGAAIPFLRICEQGLVNLRDGKTVGLFVNDREE